MALTALPSSVLSAVVQSCSPLADQELADVAATPGNYNWTVNVSPNFVAGFYSLALSQTGAGTATSPTFYVSFGDVPPPPNNTTASATVTSTTTILPTMTNATMPTVTVIWYENECGCTKTSTCNTIALPTANNGSLAPTTWYEDQCGCSKTAMPPAPAAPTMAPMAPANDYTMPAATPAAAQPPAQAPPAAGTPAGPAGSAYTGAAVKVGSAGFGGIALVAAAFAL